MRIEIIQLHHDVLATECGGQWKIIELVTRNHWWPEITKDVEKYVDGCDLCSRMKNEMEVPAARLIANEIPEKLLLYLTVNFITKLPLVAGKDAILVYTTGHQK